MQIKKPQTVVINYTSKEDLLAKHDAKVQEFFTFEDYFGPKGGANTMLYTGQHEFASDDIGVTYKFLPHNGCHGAVSSWDYGLTVTSKKSQQKSIPCQVLYSSLWCRYDNLYEAACAYWDYLLDPEQSPYRKALKGVKRVYDKEGRPIAFGITDLNAPSQIAIPLAIQCRVPQEQAAKLRSFWHFKQKGFSNAQSLFFSEHLQIHLDGSVSFLFKQDYIHSFNVAVHGIDPKKLVYGKPELNVVDEDECKEGDGQRLKDGHHYKPVTMPWSGKVICDTLEKLLKVPSPYKGAFSSTYANENPDMMLKVHGVVDKDTAAEVIKKNLDKLWSV